MIFSEPFGINVHRPRGDAARRQFDAVRSAGLRWVRIDVPWDKIEQEPGRFDWYAVDEPIALAATRDLQILANLHAAPGWANGGQSSRVPALDPALWENFCRQVAQRYDGTEGQPRITVFGMWNEPDINEFGPNSDTDQQRAEKYSRLVLIPGARAVRSVRSDALIAGPELGSELDFLDELLRRAADSLDIVTVHKYSDFPGGVTRHLDRARSVLKNRGVFNSKALWLTETGWSTRTDQGCWFPMVDDVTQASRIHDLLNSLEDRPWVERQFLYELADDDAHSCRWGLLRGDLSEKPAFDAVRRFIAAHPAPSTASWMAVNGPDQAGNAFQQVSSEGLGGRFARSAVVRYFVDAFGQAFGRPRDTRFSGEVRLANSDFDGSFFLGYVDRNDLAPPLSLWGLYFREPMNGNQGDFRVQAAIRTAAGEVVASPIVFLPQGRWHRFVVNWHGRSNGSGELTGSIAGSAFAIRVGAGSESLNAFGLGVGLDPSSDPDRITDDVWFRNLSYSRSE